MRITSKYNIESKGIENEEIINSVRKIIKEVKEKGDKAIRKYTKKFDKLYIKRFQVSKSEIRKAYKKTDPSKIKAMRLAARNIRAFAKLQYKQIKGFEIKKDNIILGQKIIPINSVGCYVPGGNYPLPSSALMSIIPAKIAGVKRIYAFSPKIMPETIIAADMAGADKIFKIGGVQAIAAMAFGTESIPKVDKIVGPGNKYVAIAKKEVYGITGIDFIAGPSEVLIIADKSANPRFIAADLLAQAEHDVNAKANVICLSKKMAFKVKLEIKRQLKELKTKDVADKAMKSGRIILVDSLDKAIRLANEIAPEHLELMIKNPGKIVNRLTNYGSLFIGDWSAEVFGDYCSGPNHTLPTGGAAKYTGGLSVKDFIKISTYQKLNKESAGKLMNIASVMAGMEGLEAHKNAALIRKEKVNKTVFNLNVKGDKNANRYR